jgi:hypothetical protein
VGVQWRKQEAAALYILQWLVEEDSHRATVGAYAALTCAHIGGGWVSICKKRNLVIGRFVEGGQGGRVAGSELRESSSGKGN